MNKKLRRIGMYVGFFICTFYSAAMYAGNEAGKATFTLGAGYDYFSSKRHIDNAGVTFGELGYNFTCHWGIEGLLGFFTTPSRLPVDDHKEVQGTLFAINPIYHFSLTPCIEPYLSAGPGASSMNPNGNDAHTEGNINGAIGAQIFFSPIVALRIEARDFYTIVGGKNDVFLNGGVSFLF